MLIIGCDFHTRYQQIAMMDEATGELTERRLDHESGDGDRVEKSNGTIYWHGGLDESTLSGSLTNEYIFFGGARMARRDPSSNVFYYFADHLGTARSIAEVPSGQTTATKCYDADLYPFGGERWYTDTCDSHFKFTGKERDSESGLDNFGARYNSSSLGRFMSPDPLGGRRVDPQTLNKYSYVGNSPTNLTDPTGLYECKDDNNQCKSKQDKAFEEARKRDLRSNDPKVRRGARALGDPTKDNGVTVQFGDPGNGRNGRTDPGIEQDPNSPNLIRATATVTVRPGLSGADLDDVAAHEGTHAANAQDFVSSISQNGQIDYTKNLTEYQDEMSAFLVTQSVLEGDHEKRTVGNCGLVDPCNMLGAGVHPTDVVPTINRILSNPPYGVTPSNQGPRIYPELTPPK